MTQPGSKSQQNVQRQGFEHRAAHLAEISRRIGVQIDPGVKVGTTTRKHDKLPYTHYFDQPWMRELMESHFAPDLALLG